MSRITEEKESKQRKFASGSAFLWTLDDVLAKVYCFVNFFICCFLFSPKQKYVTDQTCNLK